MKHFVPLEKMGKRARREFYAGRRKTWDGFNPVTRKPENPKAYNRKKQKQLQRGGYSRSEAAFLEGKEATA